jgi:heme-degrading monooxygenase HmoA
MLEAPMRVQPPSGTPRLPSLMASLALLQAVSLKGDCMVVVVFRSRVKPGIGKAYEEMDARMTDLAAKMPGFVSYRQYVSTDGEELAVVEFESHETNAAWRAHPEHREAQRLGREQWFAEYRITVCDVARDYSFKA